MPDPGCTRLTIASPTTSATVLTISKYSRALPPTRPIFLMSCMPAMPETTVQKITGAMIILISLMKPSPSGFIASPVFTSAALSEPAGDHMFNQYSLNRTEAITSLYDAIKQKRIRCFQWEHAERYLLEFLNLFRAPNETSSGATSFTYRRHGSKADDSLHAVNFAYVLARLMLDEPLIADKMLRDRILKNLRGNNSTWRGGGARGKLKAVSG